MRQMRRGMSLLMVAALLVVALGAAHSPARAAGRLIFADKFESNSSKWRLISESESSLEVSGGALTMGVSVEKRAVWGFPAVTVPDDVDVEVEATPVEPSTDGVWNFALLLRADRRDSAAAFYHFGIASNGEWEFAVRPKDPKSYATILKSGSIPNFKPEGPFKIRVAARGSQFAFFVNDTQMGTFTDSSINTDRNVEKYIGLMVGTYENVLSNRVQFRNLVVTEAEGSKIILAESFDSDNKNNWNLGKNDLSEAYVENNTLNIRVTKIDSIRWTFPDLELPNDLDITVNIKAVNPENDSWGYGIGLRGFKEGEDTFYYLFEIRGTGEFTFTSQKGGTTLKTIISVTTIDGFDPMAAHNVRILMKGNQFTFFVDGNQVGTIATELLKPPDQTRLLLTAGTFQASNDFIAQFSELAVVEAQ